MTGYLALDRDALRLLEAAVDRAVTDLRRLSPWDPAAAREHSEVLRGSLALLDLTLVAGAWLGATWLRFSSGWLPEPTKSFDLSYYPWLLFGILPIWHILLRWRGLYDGHRVHSLASETRRIVEVCLLGTVLIATLTFFGRLAWVSRLTVGVFAGTAGAFLIGSRTVEYTCTGGGAPAALTPVPGIPSGAEASR